MVQAVDAKEILVGPLMPRPGCEGSRCGLERGKPLSVDYHSLNGPYGSHEGHAKADDIEQLQGAPLDRKPRDVLLLDVHLDLQSTAQCIKDYANHSMRETPL